MKGLRRAAVAAAVIAVSFSMPATAQPMSPPIQVSEPGPTGQRIAENGLLANWFPGTGEGKRPAVLLLGGSEGGLGPVRTATTLQSAGYSVLQLSYFRAPGQSPTLERIPLEMFDQALAWLKARPEVDAARIGIIGTSKGAEAALLVASRNPDVKAVVAGLPSSVVWPGVDWENRGKRIPDSSWSVGGQPLPLLPMGAFKGGPPADMYAEGLTKLAEHPDAVIPVERAKAALLLVCGEKDTVWPSCPMARAIEARATQARASRAGGPGVTVLAYPEAGHQAFGMPIPADHPAFQMLAMTGGTPDANAAARADAWPKAMAFLSETLGTGQ